MANDPRVVISIVNWNGASKTLKCLESLRALDYTQTQIVVVDNGSTDDSVARLRAAHPDLTLLETGGNRGFAGGHRAAVEYALNSDVELIWLLNNDAAPRSDALTALVNAYNEHGDALYGSVTVNDAPEPEIVFGGGWTLNADTGNPLYNDYNPLRGKPYARHFQASKPRRMADVNGSSMLIPLAVVRAHGYMDDAFFMYGEETEYCIRLGQHGIPSILVPASVVMHEDKGSSAGNPLLTAVLRGYYQRRNELVIKRRYRGMQLFLGIMRAEARCCWRIWLRALVLPRWIPMDNAETHFRCLAAWDALWNRLGKRFAPEDIIKRENRKV